jgi:predicted acyltransferase
MSQARFSKNGLVLLTYKTIRAPEAYNLNVQVKRISSIDIFRGVAILTMVLANFMTGIHTIPAWLKHAPDIGLTVIDFIAPFFIFAIGLTYRGSFLRKLERDGPLKAYSHFITRYFAILGMGAVITSAGTALGYTPGVVEWGVLQAIGMAGLITLIVIRLSSAWRWGIGFGMLVIYQWVLDHYLLELTLRSPHGGLFGSIAWGAMLILATALSDLLQDKSRGTKIFPWASLFIMLLGAGLSIVVPVSKHRVSASYVLITLGASALLFFCIDFAVEHWHFKSHLLEVWGRNPLILYFLHYVLIGFVFLPGIPLLYAEAPIWMVLIEITALLGGISMIAFWLDRRNLIIHL